ncbi:medium-chain fatty acid-CoA ligase faa2 [Spiromyces aspiralis]|uniref:Medium-chain fatty acid-CoA ligase faa2 n=1 Tax=Spiromyces aspiralis TaxID=68401 RepID=A0ACC1HGZ3_9FUNG|nr:medium-chain fatty acid-CoA ligase faa2 [Spiromyces aspiralis]
MSSTQTSSSGPSAASANKHLSYIVPGTGGPGETHRFKEIKTVYEVFEYARKEYSDRPYLGHRPFDPATKTYGQYVWETYHQVGQRVDNVASGLAYAYEQWVKPGCTNHQNTKWHVGIYAINRPEWRITEFSCYARNLVTVALYDTLGISSVEYIINHAEIPIVVCSLDKVSRLLKLAPNLPNLRCIISMDSFGAAATGNDPTPLPSPFNISSVRVLTQWAESLGIKLLGFNEIEAIGVNNPSPHIPPTPEDILTICYTSGTTGTPKGVVSIHRNYTSSARSMAFHVDPSRLDHSIISYLPLAHCYQRCLEFLITMIGARIGYYTGDVTRILDDMHALAPTFFTSVPRLLNRIYDKLVSATVLAPGLSGVIARKAVADKLANLENGNGVTHAFWDRIIFRKIRAVLGGRVELIVSGSAPLEPKVMQFLRIAFCCEVTEGFGQTETSAFGLTLPREVYSTGTIGIPSPGIEIKLVDIPDMNYFSSDKPCPRGELCLRGDIVFTGYYKDPENTAKALTADGWVHTGDVARINPDGTFSIIDRKKNIFKLSQGEYVAPEKLESTYTNNPLVQQIAVLGRSTESSLVAVVVPNPETFVPWALKQGGFASNTNAGVQSVEPPLEVLCRHPGINEAMVAELEATARKANLTGFERIKAIHLEHRPFDVETNGLLTPTMKLKRHDALKYYAKEIDRMYEQIKGSTTSSGL